MQDTVLIARGPESLSNIGYFIKQGVKSFLKNGVMSLASVIIVTACLAIFGTYLVFGLNINYIGEQFKSQFEIQVYVLRDTPDERVEEIGKQLEAYENVEGMVYISKEEAFRELEEIFKDKPEALSGYEETGENPCCASYKLTLKELTNVEELADQIERIPDIKNVSTNKDVMDNMLSTISTVKNFSLWMMIILALVSILIISNAIKMTVFARRKDINVMKFIGATDRFIRTPFIVEGIIIGLVGAAVAIIIILPVYNYAAAFINSMLIELIELLPLGSVINIIIISFLGIGVLLGAAGSAVSIKKHLKV